MNLWMNDRSSTRGPGVLSDLLHDLGRLPLVELGIDLGHDRGGVAQDRPRGVQAELAPDLGPRVVPDHVGVPFRDRGFAASGSRLVRLLERGDDGPAVARGIVAVARTLPGVRLAPVLLGRLDLALANLPLCGPAFRLGLERLEQVAGNSVRSQGRRTSCAWGPIWITRVRSR